MGKRRKEGPHLQRDRYDEEDDDNNEDEVEQENNLERVSSIFSYVFFSINYEYSKNKI